MSTSAWFQCTAIGLYALLLLPSVLTGQLSFFNGWSKMAIFLDADISELLKSFHRVLHITKHPSI